MKNTRLFRKVDRFLTPKNMLLMVFTVLLGIMISCTPEAKRFALPEGDAADGKFAFTQLSCNQCHSVADIKWIGNLSPDSIHVRLGGEVTRVKTYEELVTSVINPSHKIDRKHMKEPFSAQGNSMMMNYNDFITITDLSNLVTFLQSEYQVVAPRDPHYYPTW